MIRKEQWEKMKPYTKYKAVDSAGNKVRIALYGDDTETGFIYGKGRVRYGRIVSAEYLMANYTLTEPDPNEAWHKRLSRAIKALEKSGLWSETLQVFNLLQGMTYEDKEIISQLYWSCPKLRNDDEMPVSEYNDEFRKIFVYYMEKYPFVFGKDDKGRLFVKTDFIWETSECKLKNMYFGTDNKRLKEQIKDAIKNRKSYSTPRIEVNYDVSFQYSAEAEKAWYSEEYRNCGNGHYYLALDNNLALFCGDD